jgi:hypothetical protein
MLVCAAETSFAESHRESSLRAAEGFLKLTLGSAKLIPQ